MNFDKNGGTNILLQRTVDIMSAARDYILSNVGQSSLLTIAVGSCAVTIADAVEQIHTIYFARVTTG